MGIDFIRAKKYTDGKIIEASGHTHANKTALDKLGGDANGLTYDSSPVGSVDIADVKITNEALNNNFDGTTSWGAWGCTLSATNNVLTGTGNGASPDATVSQNTNLALASGHKLYSSILAKPLTASPSKMEYKMYSTSPIVLLSGVTRDNPSPDVWQRYSTLCTVGSETTHLRLYFLSGYGSTANANGKQFELKKAVSIDLTTCFGAGYEPTISEMDTLLSFYPDSWFTGTKIIGTKLARYLLGKIRGASGDDLYGLRWNVLGDSLTYGYGADNPYHKIIASKHSMTVNNYGITGSEITVVSTDSSNYPMCVRYSEMTDDADIITVFGGTNDISVDVPLGAIDSTDNTTFMGALNVLCAGLIQKYPGKKIAFISPLPRTGLSARSTTFVNALKDVCGKYSIPVLDLLNGSGLYPGDTYILNNYYYTADGVHPNNAGHAVIARRIESFIKSL